MLLGEGTECKQPAMLEPVWGHRCRGHEKDRPFFPNSKASAEPRSAVAQLPPSLGAMRDSGMPITDVLSVFLGLILAFRAKPRRCARKQDGIGRECFISG